MIPSAIAKERCLEDGRLNAWHGSTRNGCANVVDFGAFVDIGVKQDGLVHISKLKKGFVKHPLDVVAVGDIVTVSGSRVRKNKKGGSP